MWKEMFIVICAGFAGISVALGQCPFVVDDLGTADALTVTCTPTGVANEYDLFIQVTDDDTVSLDIIVLFDNGQRPSIRTLEIEGICVTGCVGGDGVPKIGVTLLGPAGDEKRLAGLGEFTPSELSTAKITIHELQVGGDVGTIRAHSIVLVDIDGDVTGSIILNYNPILEFGGVQTVDLYRYRGQSVRQFSCILDRG